jgi:restriction endonuclease S subunit
MKMIKDYLINLYQGTTQKVISKTNLKSIKIPIASLERQQKIVEYCENNDNLIKLLEKEIENNKKQAQLFMSGIVKAKVQEQVNNELIDKDQQENIIEPKTKVEN